MNKVKWTGKKTNAVLRLAKKLHVNYSKYQTKEKRDGLAT